MDHRMIKNALRNEIRERILGFDPSERAKQEAGLLDKLPSLPGFQKAKTVLLYVSAFPEEFSTMPMLRYALGAGKRVVCPRVIRNQRRLALYEIRDVDKDLLPGTLGIPEPSEDQPEVSHHAIDWLLVPGLGFDKACYRIGRGAGHYDRLLDRLQPEVPRWSLCLTAQWVDQLPVEPHDLPLDGVADYETVITRPKR
jgi:5-formyltetrahydrofolate cyclo-ligase